MPTVVRDRHGLLPLPDAVGALHAPATLEGAAAARRRLAFDEFLLFSLAVLRQRAGRGVQPGITFATPGPLAERARATLPFALTGGQNRALEAVWQDMAAPKPMQRLLQGDVGSGKTIVAFLAALTAVDNGYQAAVMAPTEILAAQHADRLRSLAEPLGVPVVHLGGGMQAGLRRDALAHLGGEEPCLVVGTHALLQTDVVFGRLGFAVVDEQHRFGVLQRAALQGKAAHPDVLVMSATPIPRSLALVLYGDLDLSIIDELPPGRQPITTVWVAEGERARVAAEMLACLVRGERAYVVCPVVEESAAELKAAVQTAEIYRRGALGRFGVGLVHGRMSSADKLATLRAFRDGRIRLLVATTVVEVGVDVPKATVMVIEHADRLGLAQLHQLRGRVGRADRPASCFVVADREELGGGGAGAPRGVRARAGRLRAGGGGSPPARSRGLLRNPASRSGRISGGRSRRRPAPARGRPARSGNRASRPPRSRRPLAARAGGHGDSVGGAARTGAGRVGCRSVDVSTSQLVQAGPGQCSNRLVDQSTR